MLAQYAKLNCYHMFKTIEVGTNVLSQRIVFARSPVYLSLADLQHQWVTRIFESRALRKRTSPEESERTVCMPDNVLCANLSARDWEVVNWMKTGTCYSHAGNIWVLIK